MIIGLILPEGHPWRTEAPGLGTVAFDGALDDLTRAVWDYMDVLLISATLLWETSTGLEDLDRYRVARPGVRVVVCHSPDSQPGDPVLAACVSMGIYDLAPDEAPLSGVLARQSTYADAVRWKVVGTGVYVPRSDKHITADKPAQPDRVEVMRALTLAIQGIKGGIGKTEVAVNLISGFGTWANILTRNGGPELRGCLLDFNLDYGTGEFHLGLYSSILDPDARKVYTVNDWADLDPQAGWDDVTAAMNYYQRGNFYYLAPPASPEDRVAFDAELATRILSLAARHFDLVVVDLGPAILKRDPAMVALDMATKILFLVEPHHTNVAAAAKFKAVELPGVMDRDKVWMVINHARPHSKGKKAYTEFDVVKSLDMRLIGTLPYEPDLEEDVPHILVRPDSAFSKAIVKLGRAVLGTRSFDVTPAKPGLRGLFRGGVGLRSKRGNRPLRQA